MANACGFKSLFSVRRAEVPTVLPGATTSLEKRAQTAANVPSAWSVELLQKKENEGAPREGAKEGAVSQAGGHWFEPSTAHSQEVPAKAGLLLSVTESSSGAGAQ